MVRLLLIAGTETTTTLITNRILALCAHPHLMELLQHHPTLIPNFIEETLRYDSPVLSLTRTANSDIEMAGMSIKKGDVVLPLLASANHHFASVTTGKGVCFFDKKRLATSIISTTSPEPMRAEPEKNLFFLTTFPRGLMTTSWVESS